MQRLGVATSHYAFSKGVEACAQDVNRASAVLALLGQMAAERLTPDVVDFLHLVQANKKRTRTQWRLYNSLGK